MILWTNNKWYFFLQIFGLFLTVCFMAIENKISLAGSITMLTFTLLSLIMGVSLWLSLGYLETRELYYLIKLKRHKKLETQNISSK
ncbi:hypothetical protein SIXOD_v1c29290 (plasmid) [Spiroplasma ixodetis Y32]|nr:hypothetical protein SIXOD_v1c29290 [Spiroplasma ixodetis Y32]